MYNETEAHLDKDIPFIRTSNDGKEYVIIVFIQTDSSTKRYMDILKGKKLCFELIENLEDANSSSLIACVANANFNKGKVWIGMKQSQRANVIEP